MMHYIETHGIEFILAYLAFATVVGSMPPLPEGSGYFARWAYGCLHAAAMNWRQAMKVLKLDVPEPDNK